MSFDFSTLITDRAAADLENLRALLSTPMEDWTAEQLAQFNRAISKGAYNYTDLNRVTQCMEYLDETLRSYGYETGYQPLYISHGVPEGVLLTNIIPNGSFEQDTDWTGVVYDTAEHYQGSRSSKLGTGTVVNTTGQVTTPVVGHKYYGRSCIKSQGDIQPQDCRFELYAGDGAGLNFVFAYNQGNFPDWTMQSSVVAVDAVNGASYVIRNFVVDAVNPCWTDCLMIVDLTAAFGAGREPDQAWCDANIPYFDGTYTYIPERDPYTWYENDVPTAPQMAQYLSNVLSIWSTIMGNPTLPETMVNLTQEGANQIEQALIEVNTVIEQIIAAMARSNSFTFWSGNRPFPTAYSNRGRTWAELDAMHTTWRNWQVANWYLLLYGNLEVEGDVT